ncbi:hypothetical protein L462_04752 [Enterobacter sp. BIDMC 26]|nr:hypothetical protein L462_04752 [Enterobacter sp. BIDMC 26]
MNMWFAIYQFSRFFIFHRFYLRKMCLSIEIKFISLIGSHEKGFKFLCDFD